MKYIKTYESVVDIFEIPSDIKYLAGVQGTGQIKYIQQAIDYFKMSDEQIHNLKIAVEYNYLSQIYNL